MARSKGAKAATVAPMTAKIVVQVDSTTVGTGRYNVHVNAHQGNKLVAVITCPYAQYDKPHHARSWGVRMCEKLGLALHHTEEGATQ